MISKCSFWSSSAQFEKEISRFTLRVSFHCVNNTLLWTTFTTLDGAFEDTINEPTNVRLKKHHEDNESFQESFCRDVKVYDEIVTNPLLLDKLTSISNTALVFPENVFHNISVLKSTGEKQFQQFFNDRLILGKEAIDSKLTKNQFVFPGHVDPSEQKTENSKSMVIKESQLTKLRSALDYREMEAKNLFSQELLGVAHSIALTLTSLYHAKKPVITN